MNRDRRRELEAAMPLLAQAAALLAEARTAIASVRDDEQSAYDDLSEGRQNGDAGEAMQAAVSSLEEALDAIDGLDLQTVQNAVQNAGEIMIKEDLPSAKLDAKAIERNRWSRLPSWAKDTITRLRGDVRDANERATSTLAEATGKITDLVIDDYGEPLHGRLLPSRSISAPALGISISVDRHGQGLQIRGERGICVVPQASNTIFVRSIDR